MERCAAFVLFLAISVPVLAQSTLDSLNVFYGQIPQGKQTYFVAPDGDDANPGTEEEPWKTLEQAISRVKMGDVIVLRGGVYEYDHTISIQTPSGFNGEYIVLTAYPGEVPMLDFSSQPKVRNVHGIRLRANWWHVIGITIKNASHNGIRIDGSYNILEQVTSYGNHDTGIHMAGGASYNLIKNCDSFRNINYEPANDVGGNADGFGAKFEIGPGNRFVGCRAWENSDDGFDLWEAEGTIVIDSSWAFRNGVAEVFGNPVGFQGNGNGFKLGGGGVITAHVVTRCIAFDNRGASGNAKGFDFNNNPGAMTLIHNTAYDNPRNFVFSRTDPPSGQSVFLNNLSVKTKLHAQLPSGAVVAGNSWQYEAEVTEDMFLSVDTTTARHPRQRDGSLPEIDLLKLDSESFLVDGGVILTEPFYGSAPDIGVHELVTSPGAITVPQVYRGTGTFINDLFVYDLENADAWEIQGEMNVGTEAFGDTNITLATLPSDIIVEEWIRTSTASGVKNYLFLAAEFGLSQSKHVYVAHSNDIEKKPQWLSAFEETSSTLTLTDSAGTEYLMTLYRLEVEADSIITLGRNSTDSSEEAPMYLVLIGRPNTVANEEEPVPTIDTFMWQMYPSPAGNLVTISYSLTRPADVTISVFDMIGREVLVVHEGRRGPGGHETKLDTQPLPSGVYYCRLTAGGTPVTKLLVKVSE